VDVAEDGVLALKAAVEHLRKFCDDHGCLAELCIYDGGCAPSAPVAHAEHVCEYLFGRGDLTGARGFGMTRAGGADARGYAGLVKELDDAVPKRGELLRKWIRGETDRAAPLLPLELLGEATRGRPLDVLVGGPFTAFDALMNLDEEWAASVRSVHAMAGAWDCSTANLFKNQFNCGADLKAAARVLGPASKLQCPVVLYTTEYCKRAMVLTPAEVRAAASPAAADLYDLWHELTGRRGSVTVFDISPLLGARSRTSPIAPTTPIKCVLGDDDVFRLERVESSSISATIKDFDDAAEKAGKAGLLDVMRELANAAASI